MKRILCYGDSNTWGHVPAKGTRYPDDVRWPGVMSRELGSSYRVIEDSISGRTAMGDDPNLPNRCGRENLGYSLLAHSPLDLMIIALGTNDLKFCDAAGVQRNIVQFLSLVQGADELYHSFSPIFRDEKRILLISPPRILEEIAVLRPAHSLAHAAAASCELASRYREVAENENIYYLNAAEYVMPTTADCLHLSEESHARLGEAVAQKVREILA